MNRSLEVLRPQRQPAPDVVLDVADVLEVVGALQRKRRELLPRAGVRSGVAHQESLNRLQRHGRDAGVEVLRPTPLRLRADRCVVVRLHLGDDGLLRVDAEADDFEPAPDRLIERDGIE